MALFKKTVTTEPTPVPSLLDQLSEHYDSKLDEADAQTFAAEQHRQAAMAAEVATVKANNQASALEQAHTLLANAGVTL